MGMGIEVYNEDGSLQFDTSNRLFRVLTAEDIGGANTGSRVVTEVKGTLGVVAQATQQTGDPPEVTISGNTVSWDYKGSGNRQNTRLVYMEY